MKILLFSRHGETGEIQRALAGSLETYGIRTEHVFQRRFNDGWHLAPDAVILVGMRGQSRNTYLHFRARNIPVIVVELGWLKRASTLTRLEPDGYYQLSLNGLNCLPSAGSQARLEKLGLKLHAKSSCTDGPVLILGQTGGDAAHGRTGNELIALYEAWARELRGLVPIRYRAHPLASPHALDGVESLSGSIDLDTALTQSRCVLTLNSTAGLKALECGIPVVCNQGCFYAAAAETRIAAAVLPRFKAVARGHLFERLAAGQFSGRELTTRVSVEYILNLIGATQAS